MLSAEEIKQRKGGLPLVLITAYDVAAKGGMVRLGSPTSAPAIRLKDMPRSRTVTAGTMSGPNGLPA